MLQSLFNIVAGIQASNFTENRLQRKCFSVNTAKIFKNYFFYRVPLVADYVSRSWNKF